ncbi:hypothetical protein BDV25DRAFT_168577 [Aspergillus avenaceus]|uniref:GS catalytic domain-containing protein n=1 Tax=Aspergillus avenaceus TaxID=36643 RepID=A0A5N6TPH8_ASPAV|nr:hypothetical protein BDV25DRAFT_168577 [Aspergillus avenaceus]
MGSRASIGFESARVLEEFLQEHPSIKFIRLQWQDLSGILRANIVTTEYAVELALENKALRCAPITLHCLADNFALPYGAGAHNLHPDWASLRQTTGNYGTVMCTVVESTVGEQTPNSALCPRHALKNVLQDASDRYGLGFLVGFEIEFNIVDVSYDGDIRPTSSKTGHFSVFGLREPRFKIVEECVHELLRVGVKFDNFHIEGHSGQYEIPLAPLPPMQAVDQLVLAHDVLKTVVARHGLVATMSPKPLPELQSNGQHKKLEAGTSVGWGTENRGCPVRKVGTGHWELRIADATSNMYMTLAAIIGAGMLGLRDGRLCHWPDASLKSPEASSKASGEKLPTNFDSALDVLEQGISSFDGSLDRRTTQHYIYVKRTESSRLKALDEKSVRAILASLF